MCVRAQNLRSQNKIEVMHERSLVRAKANKIVEKASFLTWTGLKQAIPFILKTIEYTAFTETTSL